MRRAVVVLVLLGMMVGLRTLKAEDVTAIGNPLTLAAIGFVVLASFAVAEAGGALKLPRVTGYIVAGVLLGPSMLDVLSAQVVREMQVFNTLALGLIAVGAGLELDVRSIGRLWRTHTATTLVKLLAGAVLVGGSFALIESWLGILGLQGSALWAVALVLGTLSVGTSPAVALALIKETGAAGRLSDLVLGAAVLKDLVVVVCLALAVAVARAMVEPGADIEPALLLAVGKEIGASIAAGALLGGVLIAYIRFVKAEMLLFVAAMILVVGELSRTLHLELLLVFITAGFVVRNASRFEHELMGAITMVALPVFVVFFTIAGASIDLGTTRAVLPIAATLVVARAIGFVTASHVGGWVGREPAALRRLAWLGYLPQAGVTLGLVGLAATQLPAVGDAIRNTGMAVVALNLLIGPITLRRALQSAGETAKVAPPAADEASRPSSADAPLTTPARATVATKEREARFAAALREVESAPIRRALRAMVRDVRDLLAGFVARDVAAWSAREIAIALESGHGSHAKAAANGLGVQGEQDFEQLSVGASALRGLFSDVRARLRELPERLDVPLEPHLLAPGSGDSLALWARKRSRSVMTRLSGRARQRRVPVRLAARLALEARTARFCVGVLAGWMRLRGELLDEQRRRDQSRQDGEATARRIEELAERFQAVTLDDALHALETGLTELVELVKTADSPERPLGAIRLSTVEPVVAKAIARLDSAAIDWRDKLRAAGDRTTLAIDLFRAERAAAREVDAHVIAPIARAVGRARRLVDVASRRIERIIERVSPEATAPVPPNEGMGDGAARSTPPPSSDPVGDEPVQAAQVSAGDPATDAPAEQERPLEGEGLAELGELARAVWTAADRASAEQAFVTLRGELEIHEAVVALRGIIESLPDVVTVTVQGSGLREASWSGDVRTQRFAVRSTAHRGLVAETMPVIDELARDASSCVSEIGQTLSDAASLLDDSIACRREAPAHATRADALLRDDVVRSLGLAHRAAKALEELDRRLCQVGEDAVRSLFAEVARTIGAEDHVSAGSVGKLRRLLQRARAWVAPGAGYALGALQRVTRLARNVAGRTASGAREATEQSTDAATIRSRLARWRTAPDVPPAYERLFRATALRDPRFFTARTEELGRVVEAEHLWIDGEGASSAIVIGEPGSGRSSLLNMASLRLRAPRVLRPTRSRGPLADTLVEALALELACGSTPASVKRSLTFDRTTVLLDDLEQWFTPDHLGVAELERIVDLIVSTQHSVFWIASVNAAALDVIEDWLPLREAFGRAVELLPLDSAALCTVLEARHQASGRELRYPRTVLSRFVGGFRSTSDRGLYHRLLTTVVDGNLQQALALWLRAVEFDAKGTATPALARTLEAGRPLGASLGPAETALLARLMRFGPARPADLARYLHLPPHELSLHMSFLRASGLVDAPSSNAATVEVPAAVRRVVARLLASVGLWRARS